MQAMRVQGGAYLTLLNTVANMGVVLLKARPAMI